MTKESYRGFTETGGVVQMWNVSFRGVEHWVVQTYEPGQTRPIRTREFKTKRWADAWFNRFRVPVQGPYVKGALMLRATSLRCHSLTFDGNGLDDMLGLCNGNGLYLVLSWVEWYDWTRAESLKRSMPLEGATA